MENIENYSFYYFSFNDKANQFTCLFATREREPNDIKIYQQLKPRLDCASAEYAQSLHFTDFYGFIANWCEYRRFLSDCAVAKSDQSLPSYILQVA